MKHGGWKQNRATYQCWQDMKARCYNPACHNFKNYGARGIIVCDEWKYDFARFLTDMGEKPVGLTLDRKDNDGPYSKDNCRWATRAEQRRNQRGNVYVEYRGLRMTIEEASRHAGIHPETIRTRRRMGWPKEKWFAPINVKCRHKTTAMSRPGQEGGT